MTRRRRGRCPGSDARGGDSRVTDVTRAATAASSIDLSRRDLTLDIARVFCVMSVVVIHLLMVGVGRDADGALVVSRPLENQPWFAPVTWAGQIMPLFFVVGGFASITAWRSLRRRGGDAAEYVRGRVLRLAQPALPLYAFYAVVLGGAALVGVDPSLLAVVAQGAGAPLWFLAAYTLCQALVPAMARLHLRAPRRTVAALAVGAVLVDALRYSSGIDPVGLANLFFVWLLVQQLGFWYADGWFADRRPWQLVLVAGACYLALLPMTVVGPYSTDMLTNLNPPTVPLVLLGLAQACILRLIRPALARLMRTRPARAAVFVIGSRLMTIYLWHLPIIIVLSGIALLIPGASPEPATTAWWWTRPVLWAMVMTTIFGLSFLVGRWEAPRPIGITPPVAVVAVAVVIAFVPNFLVMQWYLNLVFALTGVVLLGAAVLMLGRWPTRATTDAPVATPMTSRR
ncbi:MAG: acyltransferase [Micrococcales bacterium]|nr:acyltransferase [Micrococcales bacterium]